jgi:hypothetical protein
VDGHYLRIKAGGTDKAAPPVWDPDILKANNIILIFKNANRKSPGCSSG